MNVVLSRWTRRGAKVAALLAVTACAAGLAAPASASAEGRRPVDTVARVLPTVCAEVRLPVTLSESDPTQYRIAGQLCSKPSLRRNRTVHVLISGATYGHIYWDFPLRPNQLSYVKALTEAGDATFNLDRIGIGRSDHPAPELVTLESNAYVIHQVVQALRNGAHGRSPFDKVVLVGHSLGSGIATVEASTYDDVDGLILTGFLHTFTPAIGAVPAALHPARDDPRFANSGLPADYLTTQPGTRGGLFYFAPTADADVIALDEARKETVTNAEGNDFFGLFFRPDVAQAIHVPVLVVVGGSDGAFCSTPACPEALIEPGFYSQPGQAEVHVMPDAGHDLNLHRNAAAWYAVAVDWLDRAL